ncbi:hypothetical protein EVA_12518 [gut metagenome]|uniref:Uncharacterized protein n=1 Tax=gut metagenome TaxID=749906 RepID=J9CH34_9ZZZZ
MVIRILPYSSLERHGQTLYLPVYNKVGVSLHSSCFGPVH